MLHKYIIWPEYVTLTLSRSSGRRVGRSLAPPRVTPELVLKACNELGWRCSVEGGKYPRTWFESHGFKIIVEFENKVGSKNSVIKALAGKLKEIGGKTV
ncbi:MAG: signal recognition particle subunit SRP19/SEC65 family protein [Zestosphaera sp.]